MNKVAFLIPVHKPYFSYLDAFVASYKKFNYEKQVDIWVVFSSENEKNSYISDSIKSLILPDCMQCFESTTGKIGIINIKKLWGIDQIKNDYEYIIVIDAETIIIKEIDIYSICNDFFSEKTLFGNTATAAVTREIQDNCKKYFTTHKDFSKLDTNLYLWFNQPCIYKTNNIVDFFEKIKFSMLKEFTWYDFDYYLYMNYLILYHDFTILDIEVVVNSGALEDSSGPVEFLSPKWKEVKPLLATKYMLQYFDNPKLFLRMHLDRKRVSHKPKSKIYKFFHLYWLRGKK